MTGTLGETAPTSKRIVVDWGQGRVQIIGLIDTQPPDVITLVNGETLNLVACKRGKYYLYKPLMSPSAVMQTFHNNQQ